MSDSTQSTVRGILAERGPLTIDQILERVNVVRPIRTRNPRQSVKNALTNDRLLATMDDKRYVYLPVFLRGASVRLLMDTAAPEQGTVPAGLEIFVLLDPFAGTDEGGKQATISLAGGPDVIVPRQSMIWGAQPQSRLQLPSTFWRWWKGQEEPGSLLLRCVDGQNGRYDLEPIESASIDAEEIAARNEALREAAAAAAKRSRSVWLNELARRLLARGVYHTLPPPDPTYAVLFLPEGPFYLQGMKAYYRPDLTPQLIRLFWDRSQFRQVGVEALLHKFVGLPAPTLQEPVPAPLPPALVVDTDQLYRLKVRLKWDRKIWRIIEIRGDQTLEALHLEIQDAFDWDNDHLYSFFLSGRRWDSLTEVAGNPFAECEDPPCSDEVTLAEIGLKPRQSFLYLFDYGDQLEHEIEVLDLISPAPEGNFPRIVETHGTAPPQYASLDEEWEDDGDEEPE
jgi:hypothetical protein